MAGKNALAITVLANLDSLRLAMKQGVDSVLTTRQEIAKLGNAFDGSKIIAQAGAIANKFQDIAEISKLTAKEQAAVNRVIDEAIQKYKALGQTVPPQMQAIYDATKKVEAVTKTSGDSQGWLTTKTLALGTAIGGLGVTALMKVGQEFSRMAEQGLKLDAIESSYTRLTKGISQDGDQMLASLRKGTLGMVENIDLMQTANKAMLLGLPVTSESMGKLASAATTLGRAMGQDATKSLDDLITALGRSSPMILDNLGLTVKVGEANDAYAAKLGKVADQLTDQEKKMAFYEAAMAAADKKVKELGQAHLTMTEQVSRAWVSVSNIIEKAVSAANKAGGTLIGAAMAYGGQGAGSLLAQEQAAASARQAARAAAANASAAAPVSLGSPDAAIAYAAALRDAQKAVNGLSEARRIGLDAALKMGTAEETIIKDFGLSKQALELYKDAVQKQAAAATKSAADRKAAEQEATRAIIFLQQQEIEKRKDLQKVWEGQYSVASAIAKGIADTFIDNQKKVDAIMKTQVAQAQARAKDIADTFVQTKDLQKEAQDLMNQRTMSSTAYQRLQIQKWATDTKAAYKGTEQQAQAFYDAVDKVAKEKLASMGNSWDRAFIDLSNSFEQLANIAGGSIGTVAQSLGVLVKSLQMARDAGKDMKAAVTGGDGVDWGAFAAGAIQGVAALDNATKSKSKFANVTGGAAAGAAMGSVIPGFGTAVGAAIGAVVGFIRSMGAARKSVEDFAASAGGFDALHEQLQVLGAEGERLWVNLTQGPKGDVDKNIKAVQTALKETSDAMARYGLTVDQVGTDQEQFDRHIKTMVTDFDRLKQAGFTVETVTKGAASQLNALIATAVQTGQKLPASLRPYIEQLVKSGQLTDELKRKLIGAADPFPWQAMQDAAQALGVDVNNLGDKFNNAKWSSVIATAADQFNLLVDNSAPVQAVLDGINTNTNGVKDAIEGLVQSSLKFGTEIPLNAKPMLEAMAKAGDLVDDQGNKLEDLSKLTFAKDLAADFDLLITKLDKFIDKIAGVGSDISNIPQPRIEWPDPPRYDGGFGEVGGSPNHQYNQQADQAHTGALVTMQGIRKFHRGAARILQFPRMMQDEVPAILQTGESVLNRRATDALGVTAIGALNRGSVPSAAMGQGGGATVQEIHVHLGNETFKDYVVKTNIRAVEDNASNGAPESLKTRWKKAIA